MALGVNHNPSFPNTTIVLRTPAGQERLALIRTCQLYGPDGEVEGAVAMVRDVSEEVAPHKQEVVAESMAMRQVMSFLRKVAASEATTILLEGENGTGKDLIAKTLHYLSPAKRSLSLLSTARRFRKHCSKVNFSDTKKEPLPTREPRRKVSLNWLTAAPCPGRDRRDLSDPASQVAPGPGGAELPAARRSA